MVSEVNPADAAPRGIESGDLVRVDSDHVLNQVSDIVPPGITFAYLQFPRSLANAVVPANAALQPVNLRYQFKLGAGRVTRIGSTELRTKMPFAPRNAIWGGIVCWRCGCSLSYQAGRATIFGR